MPGRATPSGMWSRAAQGRTGERFSAYATALQCGWMSINDVPGLKNLPPIEGGDTHLQPLNMTPIGTAPPAAETPEA